MPQDSNGIIIPTRKLVPVQFLLRKYTDWFIGGPALGLDGVVENVIVRNADGSIAFQTGPFRNVITNSGLDGAMARRIADCFTHCRVGTGTAPAAVTDTVLQAQAAATNTYLTGAGNSGTTRPTATRHELLRTYDFALGALNGTFGELGFSWSGVATEPLFSRVQIASGGTPTTVTVTPAQQLRVVYRLGVNFAPAAHTAMTVDIPGWGPTPGVHAIQNTALGAPIVEVATTGASSPDVHRNNLEAAVIGLDGFVSTTSTALATVGEVVSRVNTSAKNRVLAAYTAGSFFRDHHLDFLLGEANNPALRSCGLGSATNHSYAVVFDADRPKANTHTLRLTFRISLARA